MGEINLELVANGLGLTIEETRCFFDDGRVMGRYGEFKFIHDNPGSRRSENEKTPYDLFDPTNKKVEVRSVTRNGVSFPSSKEQGYGRKVTEEGFTQKLNDIDYYSVIEYDFSDNKGRFSFHIVKKKDIKKMIVEGIIGKNKSCSKNKFLKYIKERM